MPDPTFEERLSASIVAIEALLATHSAIINGPASGAGSTVAVTGGTVPSLLKLTADIAALVITGYESGFVQNVADAAARAAALPLALGQLLQQRDTKDIYYANAVSVGAWTLHPFTTTISGLAAVVADLAALDTAVDGKMTTTTYDPTGLGFSKDTIVVQEFTAVGASNYTFPAGVVDYIEVILVGGGGGGGSGRCGSAGAARFGGGGGGAGAIVRFIIDGGLVEAARTAVSPIVVTVGAGGAGGASVTTANTNGNSGETAGIAHTTKITCAAVPQIDRQSFSAQPGTGGLLAAGGTAGGSIAGICGGPLVFGLASCAGGAGGTSAAVAAPDAVGHQPTGGGGGGGTLSTGSPNTTYGGASGGRVGGVHVLNFIANVGGAAGVVGTTGAGDGYIAGAGGGGGGAGAAGGNGSYPGGGGGGGGGSTSAILTSGAGGNGGNGYARITTYRKHS